MAVPPTSCAACCTTQVLLCRCVHAEHPGPAIAGELVDGLAELDVDLVIVDDLCAVAAGRNLALAAELADGALTVVGCEERAVRWLLVAAGVEIAESQLTVHNHRRESVQKIVASVAGKGCLHEATEPVVLRNRGGWLPWFPVIDEERCTHCQQCASFCLFDVFSLDNDGRVLVTQPANCKPNCPACARVCPEGAIIFPKSSEAAVNGGGGAGGAGQVDLSRILGEDPLAALARRREGARSRLLKKEAVARAEAERERCACTAGVAAPTVELPVVEPARPCCGPPQAASEDQG